MVQRIKTLSDIEVRGRRVLVRLDLNSEIRAGRLVQSERLTAPLETLRELRRKKASVVVLAHQGRPGESDFTSLRQHANCLNKFIRVKFIPDVIGKEAINAISNLKPGEIIVLDNARFVKDETSYKKGRTNKLIDSLAPFFDIYVNDAFSTSHREHASIVGFPLKIKSVIGRTFERELAAAQRLDARNALLILGGVKPEDFFELIEKTKGKILPTGYLSILCFKALGASLGAEDEIIKDKTWLVPKIKKVMNRIVVPIDLAVENNGKRIDMEADDFPSRYPVYDIGLETIGLYENYIKNAKSIIFKGLPGLCHRKEFCFGTEKLLKAVSKSSAFSVIAGGHTLTMLDKLKIDKRKFGYVSLSGGALVYYLSHRTLPGIEAIKKNS